jgi:hypothetical protein
LFACNFVYAQKVDVVIFGQIFDSEKEVVDQVNIYVEGTTISTVSDKNGKFKISGLLAGSYQLVFFKLGYTLQYEKVVIQKEKPVQVSISIEQEDVEVEEVTIDVKSRAEEIEETSFNVNSIEVKEAKNQTTDVSQILDKSSGVRIRRSGGMGSDYNFSLNGLSDYRVRFFIDDIPIDYLGEAYKINNIPVKI